MVHSPPFPSLGGVADPKGLTGWSRRVQKKGGRREAPAISIPLLRRGGRPEGSDGVVPKGSKKGTARRAGDSIPLLRWSVTFLHTLKKTTPAAPPPPLLRRGIGGRGPGLGGRLQV